MTGCSAGAYGAALHSAYIDRQYPDASLSLLADAGAGIITESFLQDSLPYWGAQENLPPFIESLQVPLTQLSLPDVYVGIATQYPQHRFAQTSTQYDDDQVFFYTAMGGDPADWPVLFRQSIDRLLAELPNFRAYVLGGPMHCVTPYTFFDDRVVQGVALSEWTEQLVLGDSAPDSVLCTGQACCEDPVCEACESLGDDPWCRFCEDWPEAWPECSP